MYRYTDLFKNQYDAEAPASAGAGGGGGNISRRNTTRNNKNKSIHRRNMRSMRVQHNIIHQTGGVPATPTSEKLKSLCGETLARLGNRNPNDCITLNFEQSSFLYVCNKLNTLRIKGTIDKNKVAILDKYQLNGTLTEAERSGKPNADK